jgi:hypothetical protein
MTRFALAVMFAMTLCPALHAAVELRHVQCCYGPYGPVRTRLEVAAHDELMFRFVIAGLKLDAEGKTDATITIGLSDAAGNEILNQVRPIRVSLPWGETCPGTAGVVIAPTAVPGEYSLRVIVDDKLGGGSARFARKVTVVPAEFRVLNPRFFVDSARTLPGPCGGFAGQTMALRVQGALPKKSDDGRTSVTLALRVFDLEGNELSRQPVIAKREATDGREYQTLVIEAELPLARSGELLLRITLTDEVTTKHTTLELPLTIVQP